MTPSIRLENISKRYRIGLTGPSYRTLRESVMETLRAPLQFLRRGNRQPAPEKHVWALRNVSFEILPGEVVGIIGRNGAGKTTLLKILSRITEPTSGRAELRGRVGSLLEVGTGFHSELTGRENIFLNGAILGMTRSETRRKLDRIVDFAGVEQFLDTPIKHYSSGMRVRLAFAVAAHLDTEILLTDEVLAMGDVVFQEKCLNEMGSLARHGRTVFCVSHNMGTIAQLCPKTILLEKGQLRAFGKTHDVINQYLSEFSAKSSNVPVEPPAEDKGVAICRVGISDPSGRPSAELDWRFPFSISVEFRLSKRFPALSVGVTLLNQLGIRVLFSWIAFQAPFDPGLYQAQRDFPGQTLNPGRYHIEVGAELYGIEFYHNAEQAAWFEILNTTGEFGSNLEEYALIFSGIPWKIQSIKQAASGHP